ncbi:glycosyltransferase [Gordonia lacunae]|uniref:4,4'-diaponeurosporenoate glycosyltransferase n=1 Tax=Gordonia lacunae TaxID=417102 RepID=A0A2C9ZJE2_9ACTN|nr:glycosyltransferase [Gordonia lacunae]OUC80861.1 glycosyl transferase [Gordonia lacunae]
MTPLFVRPPDDRAPAALSRPPGEQTRPPHPPVERVVVVIPVHNEAERLPACLDALAAAATAVPIPVETIVVLDACDDDSALLVRPHLSALAVDVRCVGAARRAGFASAGTAAAELDTTWFATTDADSTVPRDWLVGHVAAADAGADAYVGTVTPDGFDGWPAGTDERYRREYDASPGHGHVHGANLGVRASTYRAVGGFAELDADEDVDLVDRLRAAGAAIERGAQVPVRTSTRRAGRTRHGFASYLRDLAGDRPGEAAG